MQTRRRRRILGILIFSLAGGATAEAQWTNPKLIAGQVGFNVAISFLGKVLIGRERPGAALKKALLEGSASGAMAHAGYCIAGRNPDLALVGKALVQKSTLTTRRSLEGESVFDDTLWKHWELTHSFVHFELKGRPRARVDVVNAGFSLYYLTRGDPYLLDGKLSLLSGSLVFWNDAAPPRIRGYALPGMIWIDRMEEAHRFTLGHEIIHTLQVERGSALHDWRTSFLRINWLSFASGVPALLAGWPDHDRRLHEKEADAYSGL